MAEITQIDFTKKELLALILKDQRIHEGNWIFGVKFVFTAMNIGQLPDGSDASPASVAAVDSIRIERVPNPLPFSVNAAEINPKE